MFGRIISIRQCASRDAGTLNLMMPAHRQIVSNSNNRRVEDGTHNFLHANGHVNPNLDFQAFDDRLMAYILFTVTIDGIKYDAQPKVGTRYTFDFGECNLNTWKKDQVAKIETRVDPGWIPRVEALREVLALKPDNRCRSGPIWDASKYAHIMRRIENGYQED
jgi:hypothetical protein